MNIYDDIEAVYVDLVTTSEDFCRLMATLWNEDAVHGSIAADDFMAAIMIKEKAAKMFRPEVAEMKLATIIKALHVVQRRYRADRKKRRMLFESTRGDGFVMKEDTNDC